MGRAAGGDAARGAVTVALLAGGLGAIQPKINAVLGDRVGHSLIASLVNFGGALLVVIAALVLRPATRRRLAALRSWAVPWWTLTAGIGGAMVVAAGAVAVDRIGVAVFSIAFFAGQVTAGLGVDRIGIGAGGVRPLTARRVLAAVLAVVAVVLARVGAEGGDLEPAMVGFVVVAGAAASFQSAFNARIAASTSDPLAPTAVNVIVGTTTLAVVVAMAAAAGRIESPEWPSESWLYVGGVLGVTIVLAMAIASMTLGVLRATVVVLAAQMVTALAVDWADRGDLPEIGVVAGCLVMVASVTFARPPTLPAD